MERRWRTGADVLDSEMHATLLRRTRYILREPFEEMHVVTARRNVWGMDYLEGVDSAT
jgi:hypothetical protein